MKVENDFDYVSSMNEKERRQAHWKYLNHQIEELGGVDRALFSDLPPEFKLELKDEPTNEPVVPRLSATNLTARLEKLLLSSNYTEFVGLDDKKYSFTPAERKLIQEQGKKYFEKLEKEVVKQLCIRLEDAPRNLGVEANDGAGEDDIVAKLEKRITEIAKYVVLTTDDDKRIEGKVDKSYVEAPEFKYDHATRLAAARMLTDKTGSFKGWADDARGRPEHAVEKADR